MAALAQVAVTALDFLAVAREAGVAGDVLVALAVLAVKSAEERVAVMVVAVTEPPI